MKEDFNKKETLKNNLNYLMSNFRNIFYFIIHMIILKNINKKIICFTLLMEFIFLIFLFKELKVLVNEKKLILLF